METRRRFLKKTAVFLAGSGLLCALPDKRPNIVLIMADDMGYSDIGCFGGEIHTPNLDRLAQNGIRFTEFYNASRCCPTRASLMTGLYAHQTGMGWMTAADLGHPGYTGDLSRETPTLAERLGQAGYATFMAGKWHLCSAENADYKGKPENWPLQRGFDKFFGTLAGGGSYFDPQALMWYNSRAHTGSKFYYTDSISDSARLFINEHMSEQSNPFFLYVAYTAPHWPLHAKPADTAKYRGLYEKGWDRIRQDRFERMHEQGILSDPWTLSERPDNIPDWDSLTDADKDDMDKRMAVYAAQIDCMDQGIGRILQTLESHQIMDNTLILFLSDNGASAEHISRRSKDTRLIGTRVSYESYREPWANCSNTPFRYYKGWEYEGGIATPLIVHWPKQVQNPGYLCRQVGHVIDIVPTCLEAAGVDLIGTAEELLELQGKSLIPWVQGREDTELRTLYWEHCANRAVREGEWKLVSFSHPEPPCSGEWQLFHMKNDRTETRNVAAEHPEVVNKLSRKWQAWAETHNVLPLDGRSWSEKINNPLGNTL